MNFSYEHLISLYWTSNCTVFKVALMMKKFPCVAAAIFALLLTSYAQAGQVGAVSADDAQAAIAQGAFVVDVRSSAAFAQGHLSQAASLPADAAQLPLQNLAALLSKAGIDSSRIVLVVGEPGDANAQALWQRLAAVTSGRVLWLVGGVQEWQMRGHVLTTAVASRFQVPQFLAPYDQAGVPAANASRMAGSRVRTSALLERDVPVQVALN